MVFNFSFNCLSEISSSSFPVITPLLFSPILSEIAFAVRGLSPVIIMTLIPAV